jgi:DNA-binding NarL/FixJ family response regulator
VLADDHPIVRQGLRGLLEADPDLVVVGEATDGDQAIELVERFAPKLLVVDLKMPGLDGLAVIREVRRRSPGTRVLVLSVHANEAYVTQALSAGAAGYVTKETDIANLVQAVHEVARGGHYLSPPISGLVIEAYLKKGQGGALDPYDTLTERERQVLRAAAESSSIAEIAVRLSVSPRTVENHRATLMRKLGLQTQTDLLRYCFRRGILPIED